MEILNDAPYYPSGATVSPMEFRFQNPMIAEGNGNSWRGVTTPDGNLATIHQAYDTAKANGHDGMIVRNVRDGADSTEAQGGRTPSDVYAAIDRGTVYSPLTGDLLYAYGGRPGAATGAALGAIPDAAALDMSQAARMQRARDMGFHPATFYHGTVGDFPSFDLSKGGQVSSSRAGSQGVSVTPTPGVANEFSQLASDKSGGNASVMPLRARLGKVGSVTLDGSEKNLEVAATLANLFKGNYDTVVLKNYTTPGGAGGNNVLVVKDPAQLRSVNAAFDPEKMNSANLLYANGGRPGAATGAALGAIPDAGFLRPRGDRPARPPHTCCALWVPPPARRSPPTECRWLGGSCGSSARAEIAPVLRCQPPV